LTARLLDRLASHPRIRRPPGRPGSVGARCDRAEDAARPRLRRDQIHCRAHGDRCRQGRLAASRRDRLRRTL